MGKVVNLKDWKTALVVREEDEGISFISPEKLIERTEIMQGIATVGIETLRSHIFKILKETLQVRNGRAEALYVSDEWEFDSVNGLLNDVRELPFVEFIPYFDRALEMSANFPASIEGELLYEILQGALQTFPSSNEALEIKHQLKTLGYSRVIIQRIKGNAIELTANMPHC